MAEAQFIPGAPAGSIVGALNSGLDAGTSMMERAQAMKIRDQQARLQAEQAQRDAERFEILRPAITAKASADVAQAHNTVAGLEQVETVRKLAHEEMPVLRNDWMAASQIDDLEKRIDAQAAVLGRASKYEAVGELAKEVNLWKEVLAHGFTTSRTLRAIKDRGAITTEVAKTNVEGRKDVAGIQADARTDAADTSATARVDAAKIRAEASDKIARFRQNLQEARDAGDAEGVELYQALLDKASASAINTANGSEQMQRKLEEARASGTREEVQFWEKRIRALTERGVRKGPGLDDPRAATLFGGAPSPSPANPSGPAAKPPAATPPVPDPFKGLKL